MTNKQKYIIDCDDDGHWYYFPVEKKEEFRSWLDIQYGADYDNPLCGNYPDWLKQIDYPSKLTFEKPSEINL